MILFIYFLERGEGREKEKERNINVREIHQSVASHTCPAGGPSCDPGRWPDWELNWQPFGSQAGAQSSEPYQPGLKYIYNERKTNKTALKILVLAFKIRPKYPCF